MRDHHRVDRPRRRTSISSSHVAGLAPALLLGATALAPRPAAAGGLSLPGSGPVSTGRAGASVASIDDPSALGVNPAGIAKTEGTVIHVGAAMIAYHLTFGRSGFYEDVPDRTDPWEGTPYPSVSDDSTPTIGVGPFQAVPVVAISSDLGGTVPGLRVAAGLYAPNAYPTRAMAADYTLEAPGVPPPPTRYDVLDQEAAVILPSIAVAYRIMPTLDVGARFSYGLADVKATTYVWGLDNLEEWVGRDGLFHIEVKDNFVPGFGVGATFRPTPAFELGAAWSSKLNIKAKGIGTSTVGSGNELQPGVPITIVPQNDPGQALCDPGGTATELKACLELSLPMTATVGGRWILRDGNGDQVADVELDVMWEQWSGSSDYLVIVDGVAAVDPGPPPVGLSLQPSLIRHNLKDTFSVRLGGSWQHGFGFGRLVLRGGLAHDTAAAKANWERVDLDGAARWTMAAGASLMLKRIRIDVGGGLVYEGSRTQGTGCNPTAINQGCEPGSTPDPIKDRPGPDPIQPTKDSGGQQQSPFNEGTLTSGYNLILIGFTTWF